MDGIEDSAAPRSDASDDASAREAALREILDVISQSRSDEQPVFRCVLENAARLCNAQAAGLQLLNDAGTHLRLMCNWGAHAGAFEPGWEMDMDGAYQAPVAVREARVISIEDLKETDLYRQGDAGRRRLVEEEGIRSWLIVPLLRDGTGIGTITLSRHQVQAFQPDEIALVETFAAQAVIAIENVRQFRELQTRLEREKASAEILKVISQSRDDATPVFDLLLRTAQRFCHASNGAIVLGEEGGGPQVLAAQTGASKETLARYASGGFQMDPRESLAARAMVERKTLHYPDIAKGAPYLDGMEAVRMHVEKEEIKSSIYVPLISNGRGIGCINLLHKEQRTYSPDEIALVESFADQAVIAIENVRQFRELQTRLEREAATREILEVISESQDDEGPVFDTILDNVSQLCNAPLVFLSIVDASREHLTIPAHRGARSKIASVWDTMIEPLASSALVSAHAIRDCRAIHVPDLSQDPTFDMTDARRAELVELEDVRSYLVVPLRQGGRAIGTINLYRREIAPFTKEQIALVETFAAQAVIAIENVRQFRELQARLEREKASAETLEVISRSRDDEQPVFQVILENACRLCEAKSAFMIVLDDSGEFVYSPAQFGANPEFAAIFDEWRVPYATSPLGAVVSMRERRVVAFDDLADDDLYRSGEPNRVRQVELEGSRSTVNVPLLSNDGAVGALILYRREVRPFSDENIALVETFAAQAVIAIENVRQFRALADKTEEVQALNASLEERVEEQVGEIERMGRLKRFLPAAVADTVVSSGSDKMLSSHRALLGVLFCDIRGFTAFCETAEPEETIEVLQTYHQEMGRLINDHGAGVDHRMGDGIMVLFNDPLPCEDPAGEAVHLALAMRDHMEELCRSWKRLGHRLGFGVGVSLGYATVGMVGYEGRYDYTASGTAVNIAARLCDHAEDGEILLSPRAWTAVEDRIEVTSRGEVSFKGINREIEVMCIEPGAVLSA